MDFHLTRVKKLNPEMAAVLWLTSAGIAPRIAFSPHFQHLTFCGTGPGDGDAGRRTAVRSPAQSGAGRSCVPFKQGHVLRRHAGDFLPGAG